MSRRGPTRLARGLLGLSLCAGLAACQTSPDASSGIDRPVGSAVGTHQSGAYLHPDFEIGPELSAQIGLLAHRVEATFPEAFSNIEIGSDGGIIVGLSQPDLNIAPLIPEGLSNVSVQRMALSLKQLDVLSNILVSDLIVANLSDVGFGIDMRDGSVEFMTLTKGEALEKSIRSGRIRVDTYTIIEDQIIPTATSRTR